ncbi:hypothetical protein E1A91_D02G037600v1 [Gossypium mustelinum]|uniref:Cytochrome P450 n=1 Tax=Gossypium mustelinum TaxID=34275 RepID=A0A5D2VSC0_GOSMU|nr:hypothetical protein E1A91_D02G037600v1 [Gossypium mustelinum]
MNALMKLLILAPCCFFFIALIKLLYDYLWIPLRIQHMLNSQGIKGPPYRFIHGNNKEVTKMKQKALSKSVGLTEDLFPKVHPHIYTWTNRYGKNFVYWNGARPELVISEPELVKEVLKNSEQIFQKKKLSDIGRKFLGNGLIFIEGGKWAKHRKLANHTFHGESLKNMTPAIIASVETMLEKWKGQEGKEIEVYQEFRLLTSEVISRTAFGSNYMEGEKIFAILSKLAVIMSRNVSTTRIPLIKIKDRVMKIVKKREDKVVNGEVNSFRSDFLGLLLNAYHDSEAKNRISLEDVVAECKTFYFAGQETVNSLLAWIVLRIWQSMEIGKKKREERWLTYLMTMIINETLRLYGPTSVLQRTVAREIQLGKLLLPANIDILPLNIGLHRDPHFWGNDVHHFKPERFAEGIAKATNYTAAAFFPFGLGP